MKPHCRQSCGAVRRYHREAHGARSPASTSSIAALLVAALAVTGCGARITIHAYDKAAMETLKEYAPEYKLDNNGRVVELKLENKQLDDTAFEQLGKLTALQGLSLYGSAFSDAGLEKLQAVGQLRALGLGATAVTDKGLAHLAALPQLRWLWLNGQQRVTQQGVEDLKQALPDLDVYW